MDLSVITVTWNSESRIADQISSVVLGCGNISAEQLIVDNNSSDKTVDVIKKDFPNVGLIENKENKGFARANNQAVEIAKGDFVLFLNPDMKVEEGSLEKLVNWMRGHRDVGIASCKLTKENGEVNLNAAPRRFPSIWNQLAIVLKLPHFFPKILDKYLMKGFGFDREQEVDSVRGSFLLIRREIVDKLGWGFDPCYFIWFEDVDLCREVKKMGYKVMYTPFVNCVDYVGDSFKQRSTLWKQKQFIKSMITYFGKWGI